MNSKAPDLVKERPILFKGDMVNAILEGRKTQTRRVVKPQFDADGEPEEMCATTSEGWQSAGHSGRWWDACNGDDQAAINCPYGKPGDRLWVRETGWEPPETTPKMLRDGADTWPKYLYDASIDQTEHEWCKEHAWKRRPSIFMPRWASRITLEITDVRVERLNDISEKDVMAEGCEWIDEVPSLFSFGNEHTSRSPKNSFRSLWESINGPGSWDENPWVWVVEFKKM